jgi:signal peptidase I
MTPSDRFVRLWRDWLRPSLCAAIVLGSFRSAGADWNDVPSGSMQPTILEGDRIFVNKLAYDLKVPFTTIHLAEWGDPKRGEIVVLWSPHDGRRLVKRVVGVPGDTIETRSGRLFVNGQSASYAPLRPEDLHLAGYSGDEALFQQETVEGAAHPIMTAREGSAEYFPAVVVPAGRYFLMGDHRDNSFDSRYWGFAERQRIIGRAVAVVLSLDLEHGYRPRWQRFFTSLP